MFAKHLPDCSAPLARHSCLTFLTVTLAIFVLSCTLLKLVGEWGCETVLPKCFSRSFATVTPCYQPQNAYCAHPAPCSTPHTTWHSRSTTHRTIPQSTHATQHATHHTPHNCFLGFSVGNQFFLKNKHCHKSLVFRWNNWWYGPRALVAVKSKIDVVASQPGPPPRSFEDPRLVFHYFFLELETIYNIKILFLFF